MARIRYVKPSFFTSDEVAALPPLIRLLFIGLWCLADRDGLLIERPARIKAELLPYDRIKIEDALKLLDEHGFICRFHDLDDRMIHVTKFQKHQKPHHKEPASTFHGCPMHEPSPADGRLMDEPTMSVGTGTGTGTGTENRDRDRNARTAGDWYVLAMERDPDGMTREMLLNLDAAHPSECIAWAFERSVGKDNRWLYAKGVMDHCLTEGHGPREKQHGRTNRNGADAARKHGSAGSRGGGRDRAQPGQSQSGRQPGDPF